MTNQAHWELLIAWRFNKSVFDILSAILSTFLFTVHFLRLSLSVCIEFYLYPMYSNISPFVKLIIVLKKQHSSHKILLSGKPLTV